MPIPVVINAAMAMYSGIIATFGRMKRPSPGTNDKSDTANHGSMRGMSFSAAVADAPVEFFCSDMNKLQPDANGAEHSDDECTRRSRAGKIGVAVIAMIVVVESAPAERRRCGVVG
jgi:hypothetical protein